MNNVIKVCVIIYLMGVVLFQHYIVPNTLIGDDNVSLIRFSNLETEVGTLITNTELEIDDVVLGSKSEAITDLGVKLDNQKLLFDIKSNQNPLLWPIEIIFKSEFDYDQYITVDQKILSKRLRDAGYYDVTNRTEPSEASIGLDTETHQYVINYGASGTIIDDQELTAVVNEALTSLDLTVDTADAYLRASNNLSGLKAQVEELNSKINRRVVMKLDDEEVVVPKDILARSIYLNEDGEIEVAGEEIYEYLYDQSLEFDSTDIGFGYRNVVESDMVPAYDEIIASLEQNTNEDAIGVAPVERINETFNPTVKTEYKTYIEISISQQMMWVFIDGELFVQTPVVTGTVSQGWDTPKGTYTVISKERYKILDGSTVGFEYKVQTNYWMRLTNTGIGIHDAAYLNDTNAWYYRNRYWSNGSHGCINTPILAMGDIYNNIPAGTPVFIVD